MKYSLVIMAAGLGSRYGSFKQIDSIGPNNEYLLEYSIYDAIKAGFNEIIIVTNKDVKEHLEKIPSKKSFKNVSFKYLEQKMLNTESFGIANVNRIKPWGTGYVVILLEDVINNPFCIINADDFYGLEPYKLMYDNLSQSKVNSKQYFMIAYDITKTLSDNGSVSRGVCKVDNNNFLVDIDEKMDISYNNNKVYAKDSSSKKVEEIDINALVSMNFWGFNPTIFPLFKNLLKQFLLKNDTNLEKDEFYIPKSINELIKESLATVKVHKTQSQWFGVTYKSDKVLLQKAIQKQISKGLYPEKL